MTKVFVTGATGLLGSHLLYRLLASGKHVMALRRQGSSMATVRDTFLQYGAGEQFFSQVEWVEGDMLHVQACEAEIAEAAIVYHCAALVSFDSSDASTLYDINVGGTSKIAELCLKYHKRLCYVSSIAALGDVADENEVIDETTPEIAGSLHSQYSHSKAEAEKQVWKFIADGLDAVIVCPSVILGADHSDRSSAKLYNTAARGIPFYTGGGTGYVDVRDVASLMVRLSENTDLSGERFILNGGNYTFRHFFTIVAHVHGKHGPRYRLPSFVSELLWRGAALLGWLTGRRPSLTRDTLRTAEHRSCYSNAKLLSVYPDYQFYTLEETIEHIHSMEYK